MAEADLPEDIVSVRHFISNGSKRLPTVNHQLARDAGGQIRAGEPDGDVCRCQRVIFQTDLLVRTAAIWRLTSQMLESVGMKVGVTVAFACEVLAR